MAARSNAGKYWRSQVDRTALSLAIRGGPGTWEFNGGNR